MSNENLPVEQQSRRRSLALGVAVVAGIIATILRIVPHPTNFSSVGACSLFSGARLRTWHAYLLPLGVMIVSDIALWVLSRFDFDYSLAHPSRIFVYACFMIYVWIGRTLIKSNSIASVTLAATLGGLQFFVLTNFCSWLFQPLYYSYIPPPLHYSRDWDGLVTCFVAALPFYQGETPFNMHPFALLTDFKLTMVWTVLGDILFTTTYLLVFAKLVQRVAPTPAAPLVEARS